MLQLIIKTSKLPISVINEVHDNAKFGAEEYGIKPVIKVRNIFQARRKKYARNVTRDGIARFLILLLKENVGNLLAVKKKIYIMKKQEFLFGKPEFAS